MNLKFFRLTVLVFLLAVGSKNAASQPSSGIQGYLPLTFMIGSNLFNNPLQTGSNTLGEIFQNISINDGSTITNPPAGTIVSLWNPTNSSFDTTSIFTNGSWSIDLILPPGTGALLVTPKQFTNYFMGTVLNGDGSFFSETGNPPPLFSSPNGIYLLGDKGFFAADVGFDTGTNIFLNIIGRIPFVGEKVTLLSGTSTYLGNGAWDSIPKLDAGQSAFLTIMAEPPPPMTIICTNNNIIISWSSSASPWTLQTNSDLVNGAWGNYTGAITNNAITNSSATGNLFFRLSYP